MEIEIANLIGTISILVVVVLGFTGTVTNTTSALATHRVETLEAFHANADSMRAEVRSYREEANAHFNAISEGQARMLILFAEKSIPPYLDSYIEVHVEKAFQKREATK